MSNTVLTKAIELMDKYEHTKGWFARDANGDEVGESSENACSLCAMGFIDLAWRQLYYESDYNNDKLAQAYGAVKECLPEGFENIALYNDAPETTKEDILNLFRKANEGSIS